jgi:N-acetyl-S-(2-succino)cysteine monooxygenase
VSAEKYTLILLPSVPIIVWGRLPYFPGGLEDFVNGVIPKLQRRGLFRTGYESSTLRGNRELPIPEYRHAGMRELEAAS